MKKINKITAALILPFLMILNSCMDPIFYEIRKDVKPEKATVSGNIASITRFTGDDGTEYIYTAADKGLRRKKASNESHGSWSEQSIPFELIHFDFDSTSYIGEQLLTVMADANTLYLISAVYNTTGTEGNTIPSSLHLWAKPNGGSWKRVSFSFPVGYDYDSETFISLFNVFQTNAPKKEHRYAYVCKYVSGDYICYQLNGTSEPIKVTISKLEDSSGTRPYSAVYHNGVKFFSTTASTTNETYKTDATRTYYTDNDKLYYSDGTGYKKALSVDRKISALATCKDSILIGLGNIHDRDSDAGGITRATLNEEGIPASSTSDFSTNAAFQITNAYTVLTLLNATPEKNETASALYSSITFSSNYGLHENIGLWSYYPGRGNWNRE